MCAGVVMATTRFCRRRGVEVRQGLVKRWQWLVWVPARCASDMGKWCAVLLAVRWPWAARSVRQVSRACRHAIEGPRGWSLALDELTGAWSYLGRAVLRAEGLGARNQGGSRRPDPVSQGGRRRGKKVRGTAVAWSRRRAGRRRWGSRWPAAFPGAIGPARQGRGRVHECVCVSWSGVAPGSSRRRRLGQGRGLAWSRPWTRRCSSGARADMVSGSKAGQAGD